MKLIDKAINEWDTNKIYAYEGVIKILYII